MNCGNLHSSLHQTKWTTAMLASRELPLPLSWGEQYCFNSPNPTSAFKLRETVCERGPNVVFLCQLSIAKGHWCGLREIQKAARGDAMGIWATWSYFFYFQDFLDPDLVYTIYNVWRTSDVHSQPYVLVDQYISYRSLCKKLPPNLVTPICYLTWFLGIRNQGTASLGESSSGSLKRQKSGGQPVLKSLQV